MRVDGRRRSRPHALANCHKGGEDIFAGIENLVFHPAAEQIGFHFQEAIKNGAVDVGEPEA